MPDDDYEDVLDPDQDGDHNLRLLRKQAKQAATLEKELAATRRELTIFKAGLTDLNADQITALAAVHQGDDTPEALRATAEKLGWAKPAEPEVPKDEVEGLNRIAEMSTNSTPSGQVDHKEGMRKALEEGGDQGLMEYLERHGIPTANTV